MLHTYSKVDPLDKLILCVRLAVLVAVTLTVPVVLFPVTFLAIWTLLFTFHAKMYQQQSADGDDRFRMAVQ